MHVRFKHSVHTAACILSYIICIYTYMLRFMMLPLTTYIHDINTHACIPAQAHDAAIHYIHTYRTYIHTCIHAYIAYMHAYIHTYTGA